MFKNDCTKIDKTAEKSCRNKLNDFSLKTENILYSLILQLGYLIPESKAG